MPESKGVKKSKGRSIFSEQEQKDLFVKFLDVESQKHEIEKIRAENEAKELEISERTSQTAYDIAKTDLKNQAEYFRQDHDFKIILTSKIFLFALVALFIIAGITVFLCIYNPEILKVLIQYAFDFGKFVIGAILGYFFHSYRMNKPQSQPTPPE